MKILIVDDESIVRAQVAKMVQGLNPGYVVRQAGNGDEAAQMLGEESFDLVISDIRMPGMDGLSLSLHIQQNYPDIVLIILTGYADFEYAVTAIERGIYQYLVKPVSKEKLIELIAKVEDMVLKRRYDQKLGDLRNKHIIENHLRDLLYEMPFPNYDRMLLPPFEEISLLVIMPIKEEKWDESLLLYSIKNYFEQSFDSTDVLFSVVEENHITIIRFNSKRQSSSEIMEKYDQAIKQLQAVLKVSLSKYFAGNCVDLSNLRYLYQTSLQKLGIWEEPKTVKKTEASNHLLRKALEMMEHNISDNLSLAQIAGSLEVNPNYLSNLFKVETDTTFTRHLLRIRMDKAKKLLVESNLKIYQICHEIGFLDQAYFTRVFKSVVGMTPFEYRNLH